MTNWALTPAWDVLPNGLRLARLPEARWRRSLVQVAASVGSARTELTLAGQPRTLAAGAAHLLEHVVGQRVIQALGDRPEIRVAANTGRWVTSYSIWQTEPDWPLVARLLAAVAAGGMGRSSSTSARWSPARSPSARPTRPSTPAALHAIYHRHPIRRPGVGRLDDLRSIWPAQLEQPHAWCYTAAGLTLWIAGPLAAAVDRAALGALHLPPGPARSTG
ncbi:MAG TPA: hypothetical protein VD886_14490 [Herpetosiphonaceae bacterium]|nr:hypothetical protein [Herpetosiphonaceae bacterium]